jgi:hypothetical protein
VLEINPCLPGKTYGVAGESSVFLYGYFQHSCSFLKVKKNPAEPGMEKKTLSVMPGKNEGNDDATKAFSCLQIYVFVLT